LQNQVVFGSIESSVFFILGTIFWTSTAQDINKQLKNEIESIEAPRPHRDLRSFLAVCLTLLLVECLQNAAKQALLEALTVVKAKGADPSICPFLPQCN